MTDAVNQLFDNFAANPFTGSRVNNTPQELAAHDPTGNPQPQGWIAPGAIDDIASFAASIRPVFLVTALPALPDANYPVGQFVYKTNDVPPRLYKNVADAWVAAVGPNDIQADSITAGQIAAGAISTSELAAGAITAEKLAVGHSRNLVANPSFESFLGTLGADIATDAAIVAALPGWTAVTHPAGSQIFVGAATPSGAVGSYMLWTRQGGTPATVAAYSNFIPVEPGRKYGGRYKLFGHAANVGAANALVYAFWYNSDGTFLSSSAIAAAYDVGTTTTGVERSGRVTAPASAATARILCYFAGTSAANNYAGFDAIEFVPADYASDGNVVIDSTGITIANGKLTVANATDGTVVNAGVVQQVKNSASEVVISSTGIAVTNGAITVTNAGATVIIDGSSDMFKIAATGTLSLSVNGLSVSTSATVTAITRSTTPATLHFVSFNDSTNDASRYPVLFVSVTEDFVANTSGGAVTKAILAINFLSYMYGGLDASSHPFVTLWGGQTLGTFTVYGRYYILQETAI